VKYSLLFLLLLPYQLKAQLNVAGLGKYTIGVTTPDSLDEVDFEEDEPSYIKGTLTLPCTHIRTFNALTVDIAGIVVANLSLFFYDNTLFKLSCDYSDELEAAFTTTYGKGIARPKKNRLLCANRNDKLMSIWGEEWQSRDMLTFAVHTNGYNADCELEQAAKLIISSRKISALASDCELKRIDSFSEEFEKELNEQRQEPEEKKIKKEP